MATITSACLQSSQLTWKTLFPMQATRTEKESTEYMKKLTKIGLSCIMYVRSIVPKRCFKFVKYEGFTLPMLCESLLEDEHKFYFTWLKSAFDAVDKKYLRDMSIILCMDSKDLSTAFECYNFSFAYNRRGVQITYDSQEADKRTLLTSRDTALKDATTYLIKTILLGMKEFPPLPTKYDVTMKLKYYDEYTPRSYEPNGFAPANSQDVIDLKKVFQTNKVMSPFHKLRASIYCHEELEMERSLAERDDVEMKDALNSSADEIKLNESIVLSCPCQLKENIENFANIQCRECSTIQHAVCFGIMCNEDEDLPKDAFDHVCDQCAEKNYINNAFLKKMLTLSGVKRKQYCILRCVLAYCTRFQKINGSTLQEIFKISDGTRDRLIKYLTSEGVFRRVDDMNLDTVCYTNSQVLRKRMIPKYFIIQEGCRSISDVSRDNETTFDDSPDILTQENASKGDAVHIDTSIDQDEVIYSQMIPRRTLRKRKSVNSYDSYISPQKKGKCSVRKTQRNKI